MDCLQNAVEPLVVVVVVEPAPHQQHVCYFADAVYGCAERLFVVPFVDSVPHPHLCLQFVVPLQAERGLLQICRYFEVVVHFDTSHEWE